ncbi:MAG: hypothetical protein WDN23_09710 [Edaphobacter sp.]
MGIVFLVLLGWFFMRGRSGGPSEASPVKAPAVKQNAAATGSAPSAASSGPPKAAIDSTAMAASSPSAGRWRVIAFTYNYEEQARQKVAEIAGSHPNLNPSVFTPTGRAPFLVALGGPMSKQEAFALSGKAKREGLPRDIYAQNYRN